MMHLKLKTPQYQLLEQGFKEWLQTLGYANVTVTSAPSQVREFLHWMEQNNITGVKEISRHHVNNFIAYFKTRKNQRRPGGVSISHVNSQITAVNRFFRYLHLTGKTKTTIKIPSIRENEIPRRVILSKEEISQLYNACDGSPIGQRDKAILAVYYGCGLRKSEGLELDVQDILFERRLVYVRKTKNNRERYVPMNKAVMEDIKTYMYESRPLLLCEENTEDALFISERGNKMCPESIIKRLQVLKENTGNPELQQKSFGLHALRHSIATHLLQNGMDMEQIALFLGHKTLDSTQIYVHLINEL